MVVGTRIRISTGELARKVRVNTFDVCLQVEARPAIELDAAGGRYPILNELDNTQFDQSADPWIPLHSAETQSAKVSPSSQKPLWRPGVMSRSSDANSPRRIFSSANAPITALSVHHSGGAITSS